MSTTTTTAPATIGSNSADVSKKLLLSAGEQLDVFGSAYRKADTDMYIAWQTVAAVVFKLCETEAYLPAEYDVDGSTASTGSANMTLTALAAPEGTSKKKSALHNGIAYFIAHYLGTKLQTGQNIADFTAMLARRGYKLSDWNGLIRVENGELQRPEIAEHKPGMPNDQHPGAWRLRLRDLAWHKAASLSCLAEDAERPIRLAESVRNNSVQTWREIEGIDRICLVGDRAYNFAYGAYGADGQRTIAANIRIGRQTFIDVSRAQIVREAEMIERAKAAAEAEVKAKEDAAKMEADRKAAEARGETVVSALSNDAEREANDKANDKPVVADSTTEEVTASPDTGSTDNKSTPPQVQPAAASTDKPADKVASEADTNNQMRVAEDRTRDDSDKLANAWQPEKVGAFVRDNFIAARIKADPVMRAQAVMMFAHLAGVLSSLGADGKAFVAKPTDQALAKEVIRNDSKRNTRTRH